MKKRFIIAVITAFLLIGGGLFALKTSAPDYSFELLSIGNLVLFALSLISFILVTRQDQHHASSFIRGVYASTFLKLMICMVAIVTYIALNKDNIHKPSIFVLFGIYAVYSIIETMSLSKIARQPKKDA